MSLQSITNQINKYLSSNKGKEKVRNVLTSYAQQGKVKTNAGSLIFSEDIMFRAVNDLKAMIIKNYMEADASNPNHPNSVFMDVSSISADLPILTNGQYEVALRFTNNLSRDSLDSDNYDGVDNIIALFNNGYTARNYVYGWWDVHKFPGGHAVINNVVVDSDIYTRSKLSREGSHFMQKAVDEFNAAYGRYGITAILNKDYLDSK